MASFNFLETFFFLSLGITFVLILLLVYHFKQRLTNLEQKNESLFELLQMFIKETNMIKGNVSHLYDHIHMKQSAMSFPSQNIAAEFVINGNMNAAAPVYAPASDCQVLDDEDEDDEDDDEDEDDEDEDDEDDDEDEDDDDDEDDNDEDDDDDEDDEFCGSDDVATVYKKIVVEDDVPSDSALGDIKVINMEETPALRPVEKQTFDEVEKISSNESVEPSVASGTLGSTEPSVSNDALEIYKKMNINALKAEVVSKGLCTDTGKLKKADMLKLLEKYHKEQ
jgi:cobalamin biosynthesis protein CobT